MFESSTPSMSREAGKDFFKEICRHDLEGIVAKRKHGIYKSNSIGWLKDQESQVFAGGRSP